MLSLNHYFSVLENNQLLFYLLALLAEIIGTVTGFGSSILFVPLAAMFFDFHLVLGITAVFHVFSNLSKIVLFKKAVDKNIVLKLGLPAIGCVVIGALLTHYIPITLVELMMSILLLLLAIFLMVKQSFELSQKDTNLYWGGAISGFLAGLIGTGGAIRGLTMVAFNLEKSVFVATSAFIDLGVDSSRAAIYLYHGYFTTHHVYMIPFLMLISFVGSYLGKLVLEHTSQLLFRYIALGVIVMTSLFQVYKLVQTFFS
jgi:uncharacterized membrane protein YfcA